MPSCGRVTSRGRGVQDGRGQVKRSRLRQWGGSLFIAADDHWDETGRLQGMTVKARFPGDLLLEKRDTQKNLLQYLNSSHVFFI